MAASRKAMFAIWRRCAEQGLLGIKDPALQCKLFDTLVLPILSSGVAIEVWGPVTNWVKQQKPYTEAF